MQAVDTDEMRQPIVSSRSSLRLAAWLLLVGQLLYIAVTRLHAGGDANNHAAIFATYAGDVIWTAVHVGQFTCMTIFVTGLLALFSTFEMKTRGANYLRRSGIAATAAALALYGALQAVDGVALKQAVNAWVSAPEAEKAARFASAEAVRWMEWGLRSYFDLAFGLALLLCGATAAWTSRVLIGMLMAASGLAYLAQGWIAGTAGFSSAQSTAIVTGWGLSLVWMIWLVILAQQRKVAK
jgi:hypothetical protein